MHFLLHVGYDNIIPISHILTKLIRISTMANDEYQNDSEIKNTSYKGRINHIDQIVGKKLTERRRILGLSQQDLASVSGVTIQQIQKYEKTTNRITSGKLYQFAKLLGVPVTYFFDNIDETENNYNIHNKLDNFAEDQKPFDANGHDLSDKEVFALIRSYSSIKSEKIRKKYIELAKLFSSMVTDYAP